MPDHLSAGTVKRGAAGLVRIRQRAAITMPPLNFVPWDVGRWDTGWVRGATIWQRRKHTEDAMKIGLAMGGGENETPAVLVDRIVKAEAAGFPSVWLANIFSLDALTVLALAGEKTATVELGTAVVPTYPRHPHALAQQAATVNVACGGRLALGLGRSHKMVIEDMFGIPYDKPITHMREYLTIVRDLTRDGACAVDGKMYKVHASLAVSGSSPFPILVGALMPKMLELCGELCDGTLTWMSGPKHIETNIVPVLQASAARANRPAPRVVASLPLSVTSKPDSAKEFAAKAFEIYGILPVYRACLDAEGVAGPADLALSGDEATVRQGLDRLASAGATDFYGAVFPTPDDPDSYERTMTFLASLGGNV